MNGFNATLSVEPISADDPANVQSAPTILSCDQDTSEDRAMTDSSGPAPATSLSTRIVDGRLVLNAEYYVPYFLAIVNTRLSRGSSQIYLDRFGIGIVDWRVLASLAIEPEIPASRICQLIDLDKGAVSRALTRLDELRVLDHKAGAERDIRRKLWSLNEAGYALHAVVLQVALEREDQLVRGITEEDLETFRNVMRQMHANLQDM
ncbi:MarR family transcriptional regulator [Cereibacter sphaeroides]|nr:MarR family transcriptional regulator [Cereibacter sphaeroides]